MSVTIRVAPAAHAALTDIARAQAVSLTEALSRAVAAYHREVFLDGMAREFEALRADPRAWAEESAELAAWSTTATDGLRGEPRHPDAGPAAPVAPVRRGAAARVARRR